MQESQDIIAKYPDRVPVSLFALIDKFYDRSQVGTLIRLSEFSASLCNPKVISQVDSFCLKLDVYLELRLLNLIMN